MTQTIETYLQVCACCLNLSGYSLVFNLKRSIHMRTFQKTVFNATGGRKPLITATVLILFALLYKCIQLLVLVIKFL